MSHGCQCSTCRPATEQRLAVEAQRHLMFDLFCADKQPPVWPKLPADHETSPRTRLAVLGSRDGWPPLTVRRVT